MIARLFSGPREMTEHEACLARIDALERELFPQWFVQIRSLPKPPRKPPPEARMIPVRDMRETEDEHRRRQLREMPQTYAADLLRRRWETDTRTGALVDAGSFRPMHVSASAVSLRPGALWPVQDHDDIRHVPATNYTQIVGAPKKRIILP